PPSLPRPFPCPAARVRAGRRSRSRPRGPRPRCRCGPSVGSPSARSYGNRVSARNRVRAAAMGIINPKPKLEPGDNLVWKSLANHVDGPSYTLYGMQAAAGGQLVVTDRRMFFQPGRADRAIGAEAWTCPVGDVVGIETVGKDSEIFAGGMRDRLGVRTKDGLAGFVVNKLEQTQNRLPPFLRLTSS